MNKKIIFGFVLAPIIIPLFFILVDLLTKLEAGVSIELSMIIGIFLNYGIYAYIFTFILGIPTYLLMKRKDTLSLINFMVVGAFLSLVPIVIFGLVFGVDKISFYLSCVISTMLASSLFWLIAVRDQSVIR